MLLAGVELERASAAAIQIIVYPTRPLELV